MIKLGRPLVNRPVDIAILVLLAAAAAWSVLALPRMRLDPKLSGTLPDSQEKRKNEAAIALFPDEALVILSLPCGDPYAPVSIARLRALSAAALSARAGSGAAPWKSYSPATVDDFVRRGDELVSAPLLGPGDDGPALKSRLALSPLLTRLFLSGDGRAWSVLLVAKTEGAELLAAIDDLKSSFPELRVAGDSYYLALNARILSGEFAPLLMGAALILLLVELLILRSFGSALLLWAFSLLPTLLLLGLFVATGTAIRLQFVLAPIVTLSLTNSYVTHMFRGWAEGGFDPRAAIKTRAQIILLDAGTTALGFGSLFTSPIKELVILGIFAILGAILSVSVGLLGLPAALGLFANPPKAARRFAVTSQGAIAAPRKKGLRIGLWAAACAVLALATARAGSGLEYRDQFMPWSEKAREIAYFDRAYSGLGEACLVVNTGRENGVVNLGLFRALSALEADLARLPGVAAVYGPTDLVREALARFEGSKATAEDPRSEADIGESLELLSSAGGGLFSRGFVDSAWTSAKIRINVVPDFRAAQDFPPLRESAERIARARLPAGTELLWSGEVVANSISDRAYIQGQVSGGIGFFGLLFVGLCLVFRSIPRAFAVSIVPMTGFLATIGVMGLFGWKVSAVHAIALATVAGTGVDNAIVLVIRGWTAEARDATVDTTILIVISMMALFLCSSFLVVQTAIACMAGLVASTLTAVVVLPAIPAAGKSRGLKAFHR